jgi:hypothetical protein
MCGSGKFCSKISRGIHFLRNIMALHPVVEAVTDRIIKRSSASRAAYLAHLDAARVQGVQRSALSCTNLAHGFAAFPANDKLKLKRIPQAVDRDCVGLQRHAVGAPAFRDLPRHHQGCGAQG